MSLKSEIVAFAFGVLLILVTFGDAHLVWTVGNLDNIFGIRYWKLIDVLYPLASIAVFLLYGRVKGGLRINLLTAVLFFSYLVALALVNIDDISVVLNLGIMPTRTYWLAIEWFYPLYSCVAFFMFGKANQLRKTKN